MNEVGDVKIYCTFRSAAHVVVLTFIIGLVLGLSIGTYTWSTSAASRSAVEVDHALPDLGRIIGGTSNVA